MVSNRGLFVPQVIGRDRPFPAAFVSGRGVRILLETKLMNDNAAERKRRKGLVITKQWIGNVC